MKKRNFVLRGFNAFTLAEVLITLVIIGVIGALTVPSLIQNTQKQEYVTALKKAYSVLSQTSQKIIAEEGSAKVDENGESWAKDTNSMYNAFKEHLNYIKACDAGNTECDYQMHYFTGQNSHYGNSGYPSLILADGMRIIFQLTHNTCSGNDGGVTDYCGHIWADLNGIKGPNKLGRDYFWFILKENGVYPRGTDADGWCAPGLGYGCTERVLRESAMNY